MGEQGGQAPKRFEQKHDSYFGRSPEAAPGRKRLSVGRARRALAPPNPDPVSPAIGGRWQEESGDFVMLINQAGSHVECWLAPNSSGSVGQRRVHRLGGDRVDERFFKLHVYPDPERFGGEIEFLGPSKLRMKLSLGARTEEAILVPIDQGGATRSDAV